MRFSPLSTLLLNVEHDWILIQGYAQSHKCNLPPNWGYSNELKRFWSVSSRVNDFSIFWKKNKRNEINIRYDQKWSQCYSRTSKWISLILPLPSFHWQYKNSFHLLKKAKFKNWNLHLPEALIRMKIGAPKFYSNLVSDICNTIHTWKKKNLVQQKYPPLLFRSFSSARSTNADLVTV